MIGLLLTTLGAWAAPVDGTEFVIVLDNSCSMVEPHTANQLRNHPATDPDRRSVLGAQIVEGLTRGTPDALTVVGLPRTRLVKPPVHTTAEEIRGFTPATGTWMTRSLNVAKRVLSTTERNQKVLMVLSDGRPSDISDPSAARAMLDLDGANADASTMVLGMLSDGDDAAQTFLKAFAGNSDNYQRVEDGADLVHHFTDAYAKAMGSRSLTGRLARGQDVSIQVGEYVSEVMAVTTNVDRDGPYSATLRSPRGRISPKATGDNGCAFRPNKNPGFCEPPRLHYQVWRADNPRASTWNLRHQTGDGAIAYGVILKFDMTAEVTQATPGRVDKRSTFQARLIQDGETFADDSFFTTDGFQATARIGSETLPLTSIGGGVFEGSFVPQSGQPVPVTVEFQNTWMSKLARGTLSVVKPPDLAFEGPGAIDFGAWTGGRWATTECRPFRFESNHPYNDDSLSFTFDGIPTGATASIRPVDSGGFEVCVRAKGCCGTLAGQASSLIVQAVDSESSQAELRVPLQFDVSPTGFLRCWWPWILAVVLFLLLVWFLLGFIRPHDFDEDLTMKVAGSERQLSRSAFLVVREQPKGRRGFYRNARVALSASGDFVSSTSQAAVWVEATGSGESLFHPRGPLEYKDRRTRTFKPVDEALAADGFRTNVVYRIGDIYFRFQ